MDLISKHLYFRASGAVSSSFRGGCFKMSKVEYGCDFISNKSKAPSVDPMWSPFSSAAGSSSRKHVSYQSFRTSTYEFLASSGGDNANRSNSLNISRSSAANGVSFVSHFSKSRKQWT